LCNCYWCCCFLLLFFLFGLTTTTTTTTATTIITTNPNEIENQIILKSKFIFKTQVVFFLIIVVFFLISILPYHIPARNLIPQNGVPKDNQIYRSRARLVKWQSRLRFLLPLLLSRLLSKLKFVFLNSVHVTCGTLLIFSPKGIRLLLTGEYCLLCVVVVC